MYTGVGQLRGLLAMTIAMLVIGLNGFYGEAAAQTQVESTGYTVPGTTINDMDGVLGMDRNPASLGFLRGAEGALAVTREGTDTMGSLLLGTHLFGPFSVGFSSSTGSGAVTRMGGVFSLGNDAISMGLGVRGLLRNRPVDGDDSLGLDLGLTLRPTWWFSFASTLRNANDGLVNGKRAGELGEFGISVRPGTERLTLGFGAMVPVESPEDWTHSFHVLTQPVDGFLLGLALEHALVQEEGEPELTDARLMALVGLDWGALGLIGSGGAVGLGSGGDPGLGTTSLAARFSNESRGRISRPAGQWARVSMGYLSERPTGGFLGVKKMTLLVFAEYLRALGKDEALEGVLLSLRGYQGSWAQAQELRALMKELQDAGKKVAVYLTETNTLGYYVASQADTVIADPAGGVWLVGVSSSVLFYRDLLDMLGVEGQAVRVGRYKSFPESFTRMSASEELNMVKETLTQGIYDEVVGGIADSRGVSKEKVEAWIEGGPYTSNELKEEGIVDVVAHSDQVRKRLEKEHGSPVRIVSKYKPYSTRGDEWGERDRIAVLSVTGTIVSGRSATGVFVGYQSGAMTLSKIIDALVKDERVKAIVIRVDSPGGSALGSDKLYRKIRKAARKKPVVISMGGVAASGGYFIAAAGDVIFADPTTVTGSIGIFTTKFSFGELFDWAGVRETVWKRGKNADLFAMSKPWSEEQLTLIEGKLEHYYERFLKAVAEGRDMTRDEVHELAQGRVWLGTDAKERGLIDEFGGVMDAVEEAARRAGVTRDYQLAQFPEVSWKSALRQLATPGLPSVFAGDEEMEAVQVDGMPQLMHILGRPLEALQNLQAFAVGEPLAMLPFSYVVEDGFPGADVATQ